MEQLVKSIQDFLFDLLGLLGPGLVALWLTAMPFFIHHPTYLIELLQQIESTPFAWVGLAAGCYLLGHVIKVWAKIAYRAGAYLIEERLYQDLIAPLAQRKWAKLFLKHALGDIIRRVLHQMLTFTAPPYQAAAKELYTAVAAAWPRQTGTSFPKQWYAFFKVAQATGADRHIPNQVNTYLAKYNFYRSMAFLFGLNFAYLAWQSMRATLDARSTALWLFINFLFWFSFHVKYKRYWSLTGNEALKVMYYHFFLAPKNHASSKQA